MQTNANEPETLGVPELPEGWVPPFSLEISMHDGKCYMKGKDGKPLDFDHDMDGNQLVIGGDIEPMEAIEYSLNAVYGENSLRDQLAKLTAENERLKADGAVVKRVMDDVGSDLVKQLTAERDTAVALLRRSTPFLGGWVGYQEVRDDIEAFLQQFNGNGNGQGTLTAGGE